MFNQNNPLQNKFEKEITSTDERLPQKAALTFNKG